MSKWSGSGYGGKRGGRSATPSLGANAQAGVEPREQLEEACKQLGLSLGEPDFDKLLAYRDLLLQWNRVYNLTALRDPAEVLSHHLIDCLAVLPALRRHADGRPLRVLDVGSGGGLPGVVVAILQPDWAVTCVDTVAKKVAFIRQAAGELRLPNLGSAHSRVEALVPSSAEAPRGSTHGPFDLITSRAFASLADFASLTQHLLAPDGEGGGGSEGRGGGEVGGEVGSVWAAMKGKPSDDELAGVPAGVDVFHVEPIQVPGLDAQRCLVWMRPRSSN